MQATAGFGHTLVLYFKAGLLHGQTLQYGKLGYCFQPSEQPCLLSLRDRCSVLRVAIQAAPVHGSLSWRPAFEGSTPRLISPISPITWLPCRSQAKHRVRKRRSTQGLSTCGSAGSELYTDEPNLHALWCRYGLIDCSGASYRASNTGMMAGTADNDRVDAGSPSADLAAGVVQHVLTLNLAPSSAAASSNPTSPGHVRQQSAADSYALGAKAALETVAKQDAATLSRAPGIPTVRVDAVGTGGWTGVEVGVGRRTEAAQHHGAPHSLATVVAAGSRAALRAATHTLAAVLSTNLLTILASPWPFILLAVAGSAALAAALVFAQQLAKSQEQRRLSDLEAAAMKVVFCCTTHQGLQPVVSSPQGLLGVGPVVQSEIHQFEEDDCSVVVSEASMTGVELLRGLAANSQQRPLNANGKPGNALQHPAPVDTSVRHRDRSRVGWAPTNSTGIPCTTFSNPLFGVGHAPTSSDSGPGSPSIPATRTIAGQGLLPVDPGVDQPRPDNSRHPHSALLDSTPAEHVQRKLTAARTVMPHDLIVGSSQEAPNSDEWGAPNVQLLEGQTDKGLTQANQPSKHGLLLHTQPNEGLPSAHQLLRHEVPGPADSVSGALRAIKLHGLRLLTSEEFKVWGVCPRLLNPWDQGVFRGTSAGHCEFDEVTRTGWIGLRLCCNL